MKLKRKKSTKKTMTVYARNFKFREPFQVLVDGDFCQVALENHLFVRELLPKIVSATTQEYVTRCIVEELRNKGPVYSGAVLIAKKYQYRQCNHSSPVPSHVCISELIGSNNPHRYVVATQNEELRKSLRLIPGVPLLYINYNQILFEPISESTKLKIQELERAKLMPKPTELEAITGTKRKSSELEGSENQRGEQKKSRKRRKVKGPNPLSCKKKKVKAPVKKQEKKGQSEVQKDVS